MLDGWPGLGAVTEQLFVLFFLTLLSVDRKHEVDSVTMQGCGSELLWGHAHARLGLMQLHASTCAVAMPRLVAAQKGRQSKC